MQDGPWARCPTYATRLLIPWRYQLILCVLHPIPLQVSYYIMRESEFLAIQTLQIPSDLEISQIIWPIAYIGSTYEVGYFASSRQINSRASIGYHREKFIKELILHLQLVLTALLSYISIPLYPIYFLFRKRNFWDTHIQAYSPQLSDVQSQAVPHLSHDFR